jgi:ABC-type glycerol-3-phosphate transport system substrate-binding protein
LWTERSDDPWLQAISAACRAFEAQHPATTVQSTGGHGDFGKTIGLIAAGLSPNVLEVSALVPYAARGILAPLDGFLAQSRLATNYETPMWENGQWRGKPVGIPALDHGPELLLLWNASLANGAISANQTATWDQLLKAGRDLTRRGQSDAIDVLGFDPLDGVGAILDSARDLIGQDWIDGSGSHVTINGPGYVQHLSTIASYCQGLGISHLNDFRRSAPGLTDTAESAINQGKQVGVLTGYWSVSEVNRLARDHQWTFTTTWAPSVQPAAPVQRLGGRVMTIPAAAKEPANGWELIEFLAGDDVNAILLQRVGRFAATKSFVASGPWKGLAGLDFALQSIASATRLVGRSTNEITGFAQTKWEQAIADVLTGGKSPTDALNLAQASLQVELGKVQG